MTHPSPTRLAPDLDHPPISPPALQTVALKGAVIVAVSAPGADGDETLAGVRLKCHGAPPTAIRPQGESISAIWPLASTCSWWRKVSNSWAMPLAMPLRCRRRSHQIGRAHV